jgi:hypothetical protein
MAAQRTSEIGIRMALGSRYPHQAMLEIGKSGVMQYFQECFAD